MHVISRKPFADAILKYPNDAAAIEALYKTLKNSTFSNPLEMKNVYPSLDNFKYKNKWYVIDIGGNNLRLLAFIEFRDNRMFIKHIASHSEYDKLCTKYAKESK